jgi:protein-S-isoprenylcysteine O-methyltransferase Ste14
MDAIRYGLALLLLATAPGVFLYWFSIHPFIRIWRKLGVGLTMAIHYGLILLLAAGVFLIRGPLLAVDFGLHPAPGALGIGVLAVAGWWRSRLSKQIASATLMGLSEIAPERYDNRLITEGIYSQMRHPRYVQMSLAFLGWALLCNYLAVYIVFAVSIVWVILVVRVEEKELMDRFGEEYRRYCERVPRFLPRFDLSQHVHRR